MAEKTKKKGRTKQERSLRIQQVVFIGFSILIVLAMVLSMLMNY
jgi:hypothetical protein